MKKLLVGTSMLLALTCGAAACSDANEGSATATDSTGGSTASAGTGGTSTVTGGAGGTAGIGGAGGSGGAGAGGSAGAAGGAAFDPSNLQAIVVGGDVELSWVKSSKPLSRLVRVENATPLGPDDPGAAVVYEGAASVASEPLRNLLPTTPAMARTYNYAVYGCDAPGSCGDAPATAALSPTIAQGLVGGGYTIVWRHANSTVCADKLELGMADMTMSPNWWKSCDSDCATATTRQLDAQGMLQAEQMGLALASRGFPFGRVLTSEFCRCIKTAELMNLGPAIEPYPGITGFVYGLDTPCQNTMMLVAEEPPPGVNVAIVGHSGHDCGVLDTLVMGEAMIYKPDGNGGSIYITRVSSSDWAALP